MIRVDFRSRKPLYQQIIDNIEELAARGLLPPDSQLPSVRALAVDLAINPNTIQRAYGELEKRGVIYSLPGRGNFISSARESLLQAKKELLLEKFRALIREALGLGIPEEEIYALVRQAAAEAKAARSPQAPPTLAAWPPAEQPAAAPAAQAQPDAAREGSDV